MWGYFHQDFEVLRDGLPFNLVSSVYVSVKAEFSNFFSCLPLANFKSNISLPIFFMLSKFNHYVLFCCLQVHDNINFYGCVTYLLSGLHVSTDASDYVMKCNQQAMCLVNKLQFLAYNVLSKVVTGWKSVFYKI